jgi:transposase
VLAELSRRDLVPAIWLPTPAVRAERERARWRLHLVRHRTALKNRIHATLLAFGHPCPASDLFGAGGRELLGRLALPEPWANDTTAALALIDELDHEITACERVLRQVGADHRYVPLLMTAPGIGWVLGYTIAAEIGDITRFSSPGKLAGYTGLSAGLPVRRQGPPRPVGQERRQVPALGADRSGRSRRPSPGLRRALPPHQGPARAPARPEGRPGRSGSPAGRGDLAHAVHQPAIRSGRRRAVSGLVEGPQLRCATGAKPLHPTWSPLLRRR